MNTYTIKEIKRAIKKCYEINGLKDTWGVKVIYLDGLLERLPLKLKYWRGKNPELLIKKSK